MSVGKSIPLVSIVIVNWNRKEDTLETLSYVKPSEFFETEVIVVDNGSTDGSTGAIRENFPWVKVISLPVNIGCEDGNNVGILNSNGKYILFLDSDADIFVNGIETMVNIFEADHEIGIIEPRLVRPSDGQILNEPKNWPKKNTFVGCVVMVRTVVFSRIGLRPGEYFLYSSEPDICLRAVEAGFKILHCSDIEARHRESPRQRASGAFYRFSTRNMLWLIWRHYPFMSAVYETGVMIVTQALRSMKDRAFLQFLMGILQGVIRFRSEALAKRKPLGRFNEARLFPNYKKLIPILLYKFGYKK